MQKVAVECGFAGTFFEAISLYLVDFVYFVVQQAPRLRLSVTLAPRDT